MQVTYIQTDDHEWTFGFEQDGKIVWYSQDIFPDAFEAAKAASKFYSRGN